MKVTSSQLAALVEDGVIRKSYDCDVAGIHLGPLSERGERVNVYQPINYQ